MSRRPIEITTKDAGPLFGTLRHCCQGLDVPFQSIHKVVCLVGVAQELVARTIELHRQYNNELFGTRELAAEDDTAIERLTELVK